MEDMEDGYYIYIYIITDIVGNTWEINYIEKKAIKFQQPSREKIWTFKKQTGH